MTDFRTVLLTTDQVILTASLLKIHLKQFERGGFTHPDVQLMEDTYKILKMSLGLEEK